MQSVMMRYAIFAAALAVGACSEGGDVRPPAAAATCAAKAFTEIGGPVSLIDSTGTAVTEADFAGANSLVYFGFTYCPDVCPAALVTIDRALKRLPETVTPPRTIMISIDPERDTPEAMADYIATPAFPDDIVGLTGSLEAIKTVADGFKTGFIRVDDPASSAGYSVDHTSIIYLMDENWELKTFFTHAVTAEELATCLETHLG